MERDTRRTERDGGNGERRINAKRDGGETEVERDGRMIQRETSRRIRKASERAVTTDTVGPKDRKSAGSTQSLQTPCLNVQLGTRFGQNV